MPVSRNRKKVENWRSNDDDFPLGHKTIAGFDYTRTHPNCDAAQALLLRDNAPGIAGFMYHAPHANRPTPPRLHKGRKYWHGMSRSSKLAPARLNKRRFAV